MKKQEIINEIYKIIENKENLKKLNRDFEGKYLIQRFLGLDANMENTKYCMAFNLDKFSAFQYADTLLRINKILAK